MRIILLTVVVPALLLTSCAKLDSASGPTSSVAPVQATVVMKDGTKLSGNVIDSKPSEITIESSDSVKKTIPTAQIKSIRYDDASSAPIAPSSSGQPARRAVAASEPFHEEHYHPQAAAVTSRTNELPIGSQISVRVEETIDSGKAVEGQSFAAEVTRDVIDAAGDIVIPHGSNSTIIIKSVSKGGRFKGASDLVLDMQSVAIDGRSYHIVTADLEQKGRGGVGANKRTAEYAGSGAAIGAIIGAIAGGGKGAAIGAGAGAGGGVLGEVLTKGGSIRIPVESVLTFKLAQPLRVVARQ